ncbi:MAG TPA: hypothetical protein PKM51_00155 [Chitinophagales bacterium]|nr:hypothetical protein [Chitinophagales bacterium]HNM31130.1 hypothetical protein [Chitinophagales bacterium]
MKKQISFFLKTVFIGILALVVSACNPTPTPKPCVTTGTDFQNLYTSVVSAPGNSNAVTLDFEVHSYTFTLSTNKTVCKFGYQSQPGIATTPYTIQIYDNSTSTLVCSVSGVFSSSSTSYVSPPSTVNLLAGHSYTLKRIQTNWAGNIGNTIGRIVKNATMSPLAFPFNSGVMTITGSTFYFITPSAGSAVLTNVAIPFVDIVFQ